MASGQLFEKRLAAMFLIRATTASSGRYHQFEITMSDDHLAGKFDDVIFRYRRRKDQNWRYRFVQAKHKDDVNKKIDANQLLVTPGSDFYLPKYFQSYCRMVDYGIDVDDCIIITNIDFNTSKFAENGLSLVEISSEEEEKDEILNFRGFVKKPRRVRLRFTDEKILNENLDKWCPMKELAKELSETVKGKQTPNLQKDILKNYHVALVNENVIDINSNKIGRFHPNFTDPNKKLAPSAENLRQSLLLHLTLDELKNLSFTANKNFGQGPDQKLPKTSLDEKKMFFDKLVFIVQSPSQEEFNGVLEKNDIGRFYSESESSNQINFIFQQIENWITKSSKIVDRLTPEFGRNILLSGVDEMSNKFVKNLIEKSVEFNSNAIQQMADKFRNSTNRILIINSLEPDWTSVKFISSVRTFLNDDKLWVVSNDKLQQELKLWQNRIALREKAKEKTILVIVNETNSLIEDPECLFTNKTSDNIKIVLITRAGKGEVTLNLTGDWSIELDEISYQQLDSTTKNSLQSKLVNFQSSPIPIGLLISADEEQNNKIFDSLVISQLWNNKMATDFPAMDTTGYDESMYVSRIVTMPFYGSIPDLLDRVANQLYPRDKSAHSPTEILRKLIRVDDKGTITWLDGANGTIKSNIWKTMKNEMEIQEKGGNSVQPSISEEDLIEVNGPSRVIISGVAGTGKSTILSRLYHRITDKYQNQFVVVKIPLTDRLFESIHQSPSMTDQFKAVDFFLNLIVAKFKKRSMKEDSFFHSLIRHRLTTGDRIFLFLDGFDEIGESSQNALLKLIAKLNKAVRVYVTTRSHEVDKLQLEMSQLAFKLVPFNRQDQIDFLVKRWREDPVIAQIDPAVLEEFTTELVDNLAKSLKREKNNEDFIGVPLQCRILAESFQPTIKEFHQIHGQDKLKLKEELHQLAKKHEFSLARFYQLLEETKQKIYQQEKLRMTHSHLQRKMLDTIFMKFQKDLTKLSVLTIVQNEKQRQMLLLSVTSKLDDDEEKSFQDFGPSYGYVYRSSDSNRWVFLHRTFAEYFVAKFIFNGFVLDESANNGLLDRGNSPEWIASHLFFDGEYKGVLTFLDSMLNDNPQLTDGLIDLKTGTLLFTRYKKWTSSLDEQIFLHKSESYDEWKTLRWTRWNVFKLVLSCLILWGDPAVVRDRCGSWTWHYDVMKRMDGRIFDRFFNSLRKNGEKRGRYSTILFFNLIGQISSFRYDPHPLDYPFSKKLIGNLLKTNLKFVRDNTLQSCILIHCYQFQSEISNEYRQLLDISPEIAFDTVSNVDNPLQLNHFQFAVLANDIDYLQKVHQTILEHRSNNVDRYKKLTTSNQYSKISDLFSVVAVCNRKEIGLEIAKFLKKLSEMGHINQRELDDLCRRGGCLFRVYKCDFLASFSAYFDFHWLQGRVRILVERFAREISNENLFLNSETYQPFDCELDKTNSCFIKFQQALNDQSVRSSSVFGRNSSIKERVGMFLQNAGITKILTRMSGTEGESSFVIGFHTFWHSTHFMKEFDREQFEKFVQFIIEEKTNDEGQRSCIWSDYISELINRKPKFNKFMISSFLYRFQMTLGFDRMEAFVMASYPFKSGNDEDVNLIEKVLSTGNLYLFQALISCFDDTKQIELQDKYLTDEMIDIIANQNRVYSDYRIEKLCYRRPIVLEDECSGHHSATNLYTINRFQNKFTNEEFNYAINYHNMNWFFSDLFWQCLFANRVNGRPILGEPGRFIQELKQFVSRFPKEKVIHAIHLSFNQRVGNHDETFEELKRELFENEETSFQ